jgi:hypothetical protein
MTSVMITTSETPPMARASTTRRPAGTRQRLDVSGEGEGCQRPPRVAPGRVDPGLDTTVASLALSDTIESGDTVVIQAQVTGGSTPDVSVRAWLDRNPPPGWQLPHTDKSSNAIRHEGWIGTWAYTSGNGATTSFAQSELRRWGLGAGATPSPLPTPTPTSAPTSALTTSPTSPISSSSLSRFVNPSSSPSSPPSSSPPPPPAGGSGGNDPGAAPIGTASYLLPANALSVPVGQQLGCGLGRGAVAYRRRGGGQGRARSGHCALGGYLPRDVSIPASKSGITIPALPSDVAAAVGQAAGTQRIGPF